MRLSFLFCFLFLNIGFNFGQSRLQDSLALVALYNSTNGANWTATWDLTMPMDTWSGVSLNGSGRVFCLDLDGVPNCNTGSATGNNLVGTLPTELGNLSELQTLIIRQSPNLTGGIPSTLYNLTNLQFLYLTNLGINGSISSDIQNLNSLTTIGILFTSMDGSIPSELGMLTGMTNLNLSFNSFSGALPSELGNLTNLTEFRLNSNTLSGQLPTALSNLTNAQAFDLSWNDLNGCFPTSYSALCSVGYINFSDNPNLPNGGDFTAFCNSGAGGCVNCPSGDVWLTNQTAVDNFIANYPNCTAIDGSLRINGLGVVDISGLNNINTIDSFLLIYSTSLTSFTGLDNLQSIGNNFTLIGNDFISNLTGLNSLTTVDGYVYFNQTELTNLNGLNNLSSIGNYLWIRSNPQLTTLSGLEGLTSIGGRLDIYNNDAISNLNGLNNLTTIGSSLHISLNDALINLTGLESLTTISAGLWIQTNNSLSSIVGIDNIDHTSITNLNITGSSSLSYCEVQSVCNYLDDASNSALITSNTSGCNSRPEVEAACNALPVELISFNVESDEQSVYLQWLTASEINNQGFQIQKSKDGINWQNVVFIEGKGTSSIQNEYQYTDVHSFSGTSYYRLKQMDFDGAFEYSNVVSVQIDNKSSELFIYPNPVKDILHISRTGNSKNQSVHIELISLTGQIVLFRFLDGTNITLPVSNLKNGIYFIRVDGRTIKKVVKF